MRAVIQRVKYAHVIIEREEKRTSGPGLMILLGIGHSDNEDDVQWLANKILNLRIFSDVKGIMNQSIKEIKGVKIDDLKTIIHLLADDKENDKKGSDSEIIVGDLS